MKQKKNIIFVIVVICVLLLIGICIGILSKQDKTESESDNGQMEEETVPELQEVMDRVVSEFFGTDKIQKYEDVSPAEIAEYEEGLLLMAEAEVGEADVTVFGVISPEYGTKGVIIDCKINGESNLNYFEWGWNQLHYEPWMQVSDYDGDGQEEFSLYRDGGTGTGFHRECMVVFEMYDTGTVEPYELELEVYEAEVERLLEEQVNEETMTVDIIEKETGDVLVVQMSYDMGDDPQYEGMSYSDQMRIVPIDGENGSILYLKVEPGVKIGMATPQYNVADRGSLYFEVEYQYSDSTEKETFILSNPIFLSDEEQLK
ncbi:MAG: hypothetical protein J6K37_06615 [Lachnospiraceae bacterium]|nr:hypothetical protein [Lachnospiraceae bacterium]